MVCSMVYPKSSKSLTWLSNETTMASPCSSLVLPSIEPVSPLRHVRLACPVSPRKFKVLVWLCFCELYLYLYIYDKRLCVYIYMCVCVCESIEYSLFMHVCAIVIILNLLANRPRIETRPSTERLRGQNLQGLDPEPRRRCRRGRTKNCPKWRPTACSPPQKNRLKWWAYVDLEKVWIMKLWIFTWVHALFTYKYRCSFRIFFVCLIYQILLRSHWAKLPNTQKFQHPRISTGRIHGIPWELTVTVQMSKNWWPGVHLAQAQNIS